MKKRIIGIDVARALAVVGMILVNYKIALGSNGSEFLKSLIGLLEGKAAATFVVLAGIGLAFMSNRAVRAGDKSKINIVKKRIFKRALFLFVVGLLYIPIWLADILHFYGIYMLLTLLLLTSSNKTILGAALGLIFLYPFMLGILDYEAEWNFETFNYTGFWTAKGFLKNLFYNGFHPVIPWTSFMLIGLWFGRKDLSNVAFLKKAIRISLIVFISCLILSKGLLLLLSDGNPANDIQLSFILGTSPMPPLPLYIISGSSLAICLISICIIISMKFEQNVIIQSLKKTGQLALTFYVAHVMIGLVLIDIVNPSSMGKYSIKFTVLYAVGFSLLCILFAVFWARNHKSGPLEWVMRKITD